MSSKSRRGTLLQPAALSQLWDSVGADICNNFNTHRATRTEYVINSHVDYQRVADNVHVIMKKLLHVLEVSFPHVFLTTPLDITHRPARRMTVPTGSERSSVTSRWDTRTRASAVWVPTTVEEASKWNCMGYSRTIDEWRRQPLSTASAGMKRLVQQLVRCSHDSEEKFLVMPLTWKMVTRDNAHSNHYSCIVVDLAPNRVADRDIEVIIVDVNGHGNSRTAYKNVFKEPAMGLNPLIKVMVTSLFTFARKALNFETLRVSFPSFSGINVNKGSALAAIKLERKLFPEVPLKNTNMEDGVCAIATLFMIIRLACDQRRVFREGVDTTLKRFTKSTLGGMTEYRHILFVRSFVLSLLQFLELDTGRYGIRGESYVIKEMSGMWKIHPS